MATTTIRIDDELKSRVAQAAARSGKTAHAFIVEAISATVEQAELSDSFMQEADSRWTEILETRKTVGWDAMRQYLDDRATGAKPRKPKARVLKP
ncbi:MAG: DUF1778 domain-containing protein [Burkholderiaceae bacterium]